MESDIKYCQSKGKLILLSLGGATGTYGLSSDSEGQRLADSLWDLFGGGQSDTRPFGSASVDGFDLDIEAGETKGYSAFVKKMRDHYSSDSSKKYYISAAPQCPYPDEYLSEALNSAWFDFVWVQFYNNFCAVNSNQFNYDRWDQWVHEESVNKQVKLFIGVPASSYAANDGFVSYEEFTTAITETRNKYNSFGGVMMWDASVAYANTQDATPNFAEAIAKFIHQDIDDSSVNLHATKLPTGTTRSTATVTTSTSLDNNDDRPAT
ncbi:glycoside hydrolase superfamily [Circinella umbellata]|nr:glycoside hydrolase superfamily [Circinella umbellata]